MKRKIYVDEIIENRPGKGILFNQPFVDIGYSPIINIDGVCHKDFIISLVTGNCIVNLMNTKDGDAGLIELVIDATGGYTITLGSMFTKDLSGTAIDATANADNFIGWRKIRNDIVYTISQKV